MSEHTKEPWSHFNSGRTNAIYDGGRREIVAWMGFDRSDRSKSEHRANARRIVACVNACAGIPTARLECGAADVLAYSMELKQQRDELLAALKEAQDALDAYCDLDGTALDKQIRTAIAKAEANQ